ncbi:MAG TPA: histidine--tRNA ligase [Candidatus Omnitrophota bacterium]|nr:histidine--tRNA ligase [Candidatus Omnitrophota bacterium]HPD83874.1 histidine--tRNA ligase [Candidatus Omnitrophota bacterium]HRZ02731.1 histidine--tRNA ligase [Candidatus Omnitrophota bacterium]
MVEKIIAPRGTSDILPAEISLWHDIENKARKVLEVYDYHEIRTPIFEETALFVRSLGETSDVVQKQMLNLEKEGLSLRPEGTAPIVRSYIENNLDKKELVSKFYYIGPMFRGERPQKGRLRQFHQVGVEAIGPGAFQQPFLDAEVIILAVHLLKIFGLANFKVKINSLGSAQDKNAFGEFLRKNLNDNRKLLCADCQNRFDRNVFRILDCKNLECKTVIDKLHFDNSYLSKDSRDFYADVKECLASAGVDFEESPKLVRGLDYYAHTVFEISHPGLGSQDALGAGGRYNNLIGDLGGEKRLDMGAVGFSLGMERVLLAIGEDKKIEQLGPDVFIVTLGPRAVDKKAFQLLDQLRQAGIYATINYHLAKLDKLLRAASNVNAKFAVILGEDELSKDIALLKDMQARSQEEIKLTELIKEIKKRLC